MQLQTLSLYYFQVGVIVIPYPRQHQQETETQSSVAEKTLHVMNIFSSSFFRLDKSTLLSHTVYQY